MRKGEGSSLKYLRDLDLNAIDRPRTLLILHYNRTRVSVPLFGETTAAADLLYHHIATLEQQILSKNTGWEKQAQQQIVCFQIRKEASDRPTEGDLRSNILLSLLRVKGDTHDDLALTTDLTKIYKYLEIEPFYRPVQREDTNPSLVLLRVVASSSNSSLYLARNSVDGHFMAVRVFATGSKAGVSEAKVLEHMDYIDSQGAKIRSKLLLRSQQTLFVPEPMSGREEYRHIAVVHPCT